MSLTINATMYTRPARAVVSQTTADIFDIPAGIIDVKVMGLFQETLGSSAGPVFVCEYKNGKVFATDIENITFIPEAE